jgi:uncharacterized membrane protein YeaQ/YmgE (transglycosylase-associated protein family)
MLVYVHRYKINGLKALINSFAHCCGTQIAAIGQNLIMTLTELLVLLLIAAICGGVGQSLAGYSLGGCLVSIVVGFIGAYIGMWLAGKLGLPEILAIQIGGKTFPIIWSVIGSALFTLIVALIRRAISGPRNYY